MTESVSPYELLRMSKPKPAPTVVTAYDLYSAAQLHHAGIPQQAAALAQPSEPQQAPPPPPNASAAPVRRTHYIADIKSRHDLASRRSSVRPV